MSGLIATAVGAGLIAAVPAGAVAGSEVKDGDYAFTVKLSIEDEAHSQACTGALVDAQWVLTAASCLAVDGKPASAGAPVAKTTVTVGRTDLTQATGRVVDAVEIVPRTDRDVVMVKLAEPVAGVAPVRVAAAAPAEGDQLRAPGFGRTKTEWVPNQLHMSVFTTASVDSTTVGLNGSDSAVICQGDAGGPALREKDGEVEVVAVNSHSWQGGCLGTDASETRTGAVSARVDDLNPWIQQVRSLPKQGQTASGDFDGDGKSDVAVLYNYGKSSDGQRNQAALWVFTSDGKALRAPRTWWESAGSWDWTRSRLTAGDYNGDGKTDIGVLYNSGRSDDNLRSQAKLFTFASTGSGFQAPQVAWESGSGSWDWDRSQIASGDFNGDGKADIGVLYNIGKAADNQTNQTKLLAFSGTGRGFDGPKTAWESSGSLSFDWNRSKLTSGDFNGDGKADIGVLYNDGKAADNQTNNTSVWFAGGADGLNGVQKVWTSGSLSFDWNRSKLTSGDFNGDGKADIGVLYNDGKAADNQTNNTSLYSLAGTADGIGGLRKIWVSGSTSWDWNASQPVSGDFNGDGKADIAVLYDNGTTADGRIHNRLWTLTSTGDTMTAPAVQWDSYLG
ncbi:trypsin-like serine protease [Streptomyces goshikiensis]|uniref:trypsin-like serine protease n=3 Tax=Streptomyces goshikiensis TaxID=1942 RepID=UPI0036CA5BD9